MDKHIKDFFSSSSAGNAGPAGKFHQVISLNDRPELTWAEVTAKMPNFPRGWFELSHLTPEDRVSFTSEYWNTKIPFDLTINPSLGKFFKSLDDIAIYLTQKKYDDPYDVTMVYSIGDNGGFFRGQLPASDEDCITLQDQFSEIIFPDDYIAFLQIHNGFKKSIDCTGILPVLEVYQVYRRLREDVEGQDEVITTRAGDLVNPATLIPFYESFGMPHFQCFWEEWYNEHGMGNVYYSLGERVISHPQKGETSAESMAFPTFSEWLVFYLERIV